jgi:hypothetical protein
LLEKYVTEGVIKVALSTTFDEKKKIIKDILSKMSSDEKSIMLQILIKEDMKLFFDTIFDEQKFLEKEAGIDGAYLVEQTGCEDTSEKVWYNGMEVDSAGAVSKEAENAYYLDEKKKLGNDKYDGFLGYVSSKTYNEDTEFGEITEEEKKW